MSEDKVDIPRVSAAIESFMADTVGPALEFRLEPWDHNMPSRQRAEQKADEMIRAANLSVTVEERLSMMMILQQHVNMVWGEIEARHYAAMAAMGTHQYTPAKGKDAGLISNNEALYELRHRLNAVVEVGVRAVDRLARMDAVASRAAGIASG